MTALEDRTHELQSLLPQGEPWETHEGETFYALLKSLAGEPVRVAAAAEQHLADFMPDTCGDSGAYLEDWARVLGLPEAWESDAWDGYTDAQKQAVIIAKLQVRGNPSLSNLEAGFRELFQDDTITLTHREHSPFGCDASGAGEGIGDAFQGVWTLRYMDNALGAAGGDAFGSWDTPGSAVVSANATNNPTTESATADAVTLAAGSFATTLAGTVNDDTLRIALWYRAVSAEVVVTVALLNRGAGVDTLRTITAKPDLWQKLELFDVPVGGGGDDPQVRLTFVGTLQLANAYAGIRREPLEDRAQSMAPLVSIGEFLVKGEDL